MILYRIHSRLTNARVNALYEDASDYPVYSVNGKGNRDCCRVPHTKLYMHANQNDWQVDAYQCFESFDVPDTDPVYFWYYRDEKGCIREVSGQRPPTES